MRLATFSGLRVSWDWERPQSTVMYQCAEWDEDEWLPTPFQSREVNSPTDAVKMVGLWIGADHE